MFIQLLINADENGMATPSLMTIKDADTLTDAVTEAKYRGPWRDAVLTPEAKQRICDAINAEVGGAAKAAERIAAIKNKKGK
jgi:hypothetical protein